MGKIRTKIIGVEEIESEQSRRADARRQTKESKKTKISGVGLKGGPPAAPDAQHLRAGERTAVVEGLDEETMKKLDELSQSPQSLTDEETGEKPKAKPKRPNLPKIRSKRYLEAAKLVNRSKLYPISDAMDLIKKTSLTRFDGTVEAHIGLNTDQLKATVVSTGKETKEVKAQKAQAASIRGTVQFPHGTGKQVRVAIADDALIAAVEGGTIDFDILIAHPSMMSKLAKVAKILGPRGLMPNPKTNTVGEDPQRLALSFAKGQVAFKTEPNNPLIHLAIGKVSFEVVKLQENLVALISAIGKTKVTKITLSSTMGPGVKVDPATV